MLVAHRNAVFDGMETEVDTCVPHPVVNNSNLLVLAQTCIMLMHNKKQSYFPKLLLVQTNLRVPIKTQKYDIIIVVEPL